MPAGKGVELSFPLLLSLNPPYNQHPRNEKCRLFALSVSVLLTRELFLGTELLDDVANFRAAHRHARHLGPLRYRGRNLEPPTR